MRSPHAPQPRRSRRAFSLVEILVTTAIMGVLAALLVSGVKGATSKGKDAKCISNLRQVSIGLMNYVAENDGCLPRATIKDTDADAPINPATGQKITADYMWSKQLGPYLPQRTDSITAPQNKVFVCPSATYTGFANSAISTTYNSSSTLSYYPDISDPSSYGSLSKEFYSGRKMSSVENPSKTILVAEGKLASATSPACQSTVPWNQATLDLQKTAPSATTYLDYRHNNKMNVAYADGHVGTLFFKDRSQILRANWEGRLY